MKRITLSFISVLTATQLVYGGGSVVPPKETLQQTVVEEEGKSKIYVGLGVSWMMLENDYSGEEFNANGMMLQLGYQFNEYVAVEGRYTHHIGDLEYDHGRSLNSDIDNYSGDFINTALYLKGMYPVGDFVPYVLLGYGEVALTNIPVGGPGIAADRAERGFQWGVGGAYNVTENVALFADYVRLYDGTGFDGRAMGADLSADSWTVGITYTF